MNITFGKYSDLLFFITLTLGVASFKPGQTDSLKIKRQLSSGSGSSKESVLLGSKGQRPHFALAAPGQGRSLAQPLATPSSPTWDANKPSVEAPFTGQRPIEPVTVAHTTAPSHSVLSSLDHRHPPSRKLGVRAATAPVVRDLEETLPLSRSPMPVASESGENVEDFNVSSAASTEDEPLPPTTSVAEAPVAHDTGEEEYFDAVDAAAVVHPPLLASGDSAPDLARRSLGTFAAIRNAGRACVSSVLNSVAAAGNQFLDSAWKSVIIFTKALAGRRSAPHQMSGPEESDLADSAWIFETSPPPPPPSSPVFPVLSSSTSGAATPGNLVQNGQMPYGSGAWTGASNAFRAIAGAGGGVLNSAWRILKLCTKALAGQGSISHNPPHEIPEEINLAGGPVSFNPPPPPPPSPVFPVLLSSTSGAATPGNWVQNGQVPRGAGAWTRSSPSTPPDQTLASSGMILEKSEDGVKNPMKYLPHNDLGYEGRFVGQEFQVQKTLDPESTSDEEIEESRRMGYNDLPPKRRNFSIPAAVKRTLSLEEIAAVSKKLKPDDLKPARSKKRKKSIPPGTLCFRATDEAAAACSQIIVNLLPGVDKLIQQVESGEIASEYYDELLENHLSPLSAQIADAYDAEIKRIETQYPSHKDLEKILKDLNAQGQAELEKIQKLKKELISLLLAPKEPLQKEEIFPSGSLANVEELPCRPYFIQTLITEEDSGFSSAESEEMSDSGTYTMCRTATARRGKSLLKKRNKLLDEQQRALGKEPTLTPAAQRMVEDLLKNPHSHNLSEMVVAKFSTAQKREERLEMAHGIKNELRKRAQRNIRWDDN